MLEETTLIAIKKLSPQTLEQATLLEGFIRNLFSYVINVIEQRNAYNFSNININFRNYCTLQSFDFLDAEFTSDQHVEIYEIKHRVERYLEDRLSYIQITSNAENRKISFNIQVYLLNKYTILFSTEIFGE